jgi:hypothetical protein
VLLSYFNYGGSHMKSLINQALVLTLLASAVSAVAAEQEAPRIATELYDQATQLDESVKQMAGRFGKKLTAQEKLYAQQCGGVEAYETLNKQVVAEQQKPGFIRRGYNAVASAMSSAATTTKSALSTAGTSTWGAMKSSFNTVTGYLPAQYAAFKAAEGFQGKGFVAVKTLGTLGLASVAAYAVYKGARWAYNRVFSNKPAPVAPVAQPAKPVAEFVVQQPAPVVKTRTAWFRVNGKPVRRTVPATAPKGRSR